MTTFPNARYLVRARAWAYRHAEAEAEHRQIMTDSVQPIVYAGLMDPVATDHRVRDEVQLEPMPGQTPGHGLVRISAGGQQALITGDFMPHPCQMQQLGWRSTANFNPAAAQARRERMLARLAADQSLVIGTHFAPPRALSGHSRRAPRGAKVAHYDGPTTPQETVMKLTGRCYCGDIKYQFEGEAQGALQCHCRECQYITGGNPNVIMVLPESGFKFTQGEPASFARSDLERPVTRYFCPHCGTAIGTRSPARPGSFILKVGTLDDPSVFQPKLAIFTVDKQPFHHIPDGLPAFERRPG